MPQLRALVLTAVDKCIKNPLVGKTSVGVRRSQNTDHVVFLLRVSKEKALFLDVKDCATKLHVAAPLATKMHLKVCYGTLKELEIDYPLLLNLLVENPPPTKRKMEPKSLWSKEITLELLPKKPNWAFGGFFGVYWGFFVSFFCLSLSNDTTLEIHRSLVWGQYASHTRIPLFIRHCGPVIPWKVNDENHCIGA